MPTQREFFDLPLVFTAEQGLRMKAGFVPKSMDDKWFIFFEDGWLFFHRSWTGDGIFGVQLDDTAQGTSVTKAWVSRQETGYNSPGLDVEKRLLETLINTLLLS